MIGLTMLLGAALAGDVEVYGAAGAGGHLSVRKVALGAGPRLGARMDLGERWTAGAAATGLLGFDPLLELELEGGTWLRDDTHRWRPWVGLELVADLGGVQVERTDFDGLPTGSAWSTRAAVRPLVFEESWGRWSLLEVSVGPSWEAPARGVSASITPVAVGLCF